MKFLIPAFLLLAPLVVGNSAGTYGSGKHEYLVTTKITSTPVHDELSTTISHLGATTPKTDVVSDPDGDGRDVLRSPDIVCSTAVVRWKAGKFQEQQPDGSWVSLKKQRKKPSRKHSSGFFNDQVSAPGEEGTSLPGPGARPPTL